MKFIQDSFLGFCDCFRGVETFRAAFGAVQDGVASEQLESIVELFEAFSSCLREPMKGKRLAIMERCLFENSKANLPHHGYRRSSGMLVVEQLVPNISPSSTNTMGCVCVFFFKVVRKS